MSTVSIDLPDEVTQRLADLARSTGQSQAFYITQAVLEYLDDLEDLYLAEQRYADYLAGKSKPIPLEEMMRRYGLES